MAQKFLFSSDAGGCCWRTRAFQDATPPQVILVTPSLSGKTGKVCNSPLSLIEKCGTYSFFACVKKRDIQKPFELPFAFEPCVIEGVGQFRFSIVWKNVIIPLSQKAWSRFWLRFFGEDDVFGQWRSFPMFNTGRWVGREQVTFLGCFHVDSLTIMQFLLQILTSC